jgi:predicted neuraminidase
MKPFVPGLVGAASLLVCAFGVGGAARAGDVARWTFDGPAGSGGGPFAVDSVGALPAAGHNAARVGRVAGAGGQGTALWLDNARGGRDGGILLVPDAPGLTQKPDGKPLDSLTIEADIKLDAVGEQAQIARKTDGDVGYELYVTRTGQVGFRVKGTDGALVATSKNKVAADGRWHHVAATWQGDMDLYNVQVRVDDVATCVTRSIGTLTDTAAPLAIGGMYRGPNDLGQLFSGEIDNLAISYGRHDLMRTSGKIDPAPIVATGEHLRGQPGYVSGRIIADPPATPECHAGTLAQRADGTIVAAWFGGTYEGHVDVGVWQSEFDGGRWSGPREVANGVHPDGSRTSVFNPTLFQYPDGGPMLLFYLAGPLERSWGNVKTSADGGRTWSPARRLPDGVRGATKNRPVLLDDGTLVCPDNGRLLKFDRTRDAGKTWLPSGTAPGNGIDAIQPAVLVHPGGSLQALARSQGGSIVTTWSTDAGATWSPLEKTSLPNNHSGIDAVTLRDGRFLVVYNHSTVPEGKWGGPRTPLNVAVSDDGVRWQAAMVLEDEPGEYSYPTVMQAADGTVHVIYTWHRTRMKHVVIDPSKLSLRPIVDGRWPGK